MRKTYRSKHEKQTLNKSAYTTNQLNTLQRYTYFPYTHSFLNLFTF